MVSEAGQNSSSLYPCSVALAELSCRAHTIPHLYPQTQPARRGSLRCAAPDLAQPSRAAHPSVSAFPTLRSSPLRAFSLTFPSD